MDRFFWEKAALSMVIFVFRYGGAAWISINGPAVQNLWQTVLASTARTTADFARNTRRVAAVFCWK